MELLGNFLGTAVSVGSGGLFGLLGAVVGQVSKYFHTKAEQEFQREKWNHETKLLELQMKARAAETEQELAIVSQSGSWRGLEQSLAADAAVTPVSTWVRDAKALFRPFLTISLWALAGFVFVKIVNGGMKNIFTGVEIQEIIRYMVYSVFFCASTATTWWFGDRALSPPAMKNR